MGPRLIGSSARPRGRCFLAQEGSAPGSGGMWAGGRFPGRGWIAKAGGIRDRRWGEGYKWGLQRRGASAHGEGSAAGQDLTGAFAARGRFVLEQSPRIILRGGTAGLGAESDLVLHAQHRRIGCLGRDALAPCYAGHVGLCRPSLHRRSTAKAPRPSAFHRRDLDPSAPPRPLCLSSVQSGPPQGAHRQPEDNEPRTTTRLSQ